MDWNNRDDSLLSDKLPILFARRVPLQIPLRDNHTGRGVGTRSFDWGQSDSPPKHASHRRSVRAIAGIRAPRHRGDERWDSCDDKTRRPYSVGIYMAHTTRLGRLLSARASAMVLEVGRVCSPPNLQPGRD